MCGLSMASQPEAYMHGTFHPEAAEQRIEERVSDFQESVLTFTDPVTSQPLPKAEPGGGKGVSAKLFKPLSAGLGERKRSSSCLGWQGIPRELGEWTSWLGKRRLPRKERRKGPGKLGVVSLKEEA